MAREPERPNPDALLTQAKQEESRAGKLKIFLGYAAGVGKTYAMLEAARQRQAEGVDVLVALVETHHRKETEVLLEGLSVIPRRKLEYRGVVLEELDLDAVLARRPQLALVDELAHTNAPGSRHARRYQDIEELLAAGIDVYTTLNIQHVESLSDVVSQITGVVIRETVPDQVLERADEVILIDLPPDELIKRLHEGKVYVPEQAGTAIEKFFRPGNLTALRELALRHLARKVDRQMRTYMGAHGIPGPWPAGERVLVCLAPGPIAERLVRVGRRLAATLDAEWIAVFVETPEYSRLPDAEKDRIVRAQRLAEELGARTETLTGISPPQEIVQYALTHNVTKIVAGASRRPFIERLIRGSLVDWILRHTENIDVYVISSPSSRGATPTTSLPRRPAALWPYAYAMAIASAVGLSGSVFPSRLEPVNLTTLNLLVVVIVAYYWGRGPAILAAWLGAATFYLSVAPRLTVRGVVNPQFLLTLTGALVVGLVIGTLTSRIREQAQAARAREASTAALYALSRDLAAAVNMEEILNAVTRHIASVFSRQVAIFLPGDGKLEMAVQSGDFPFTDNERAVATWVFAHGEPAGRGTETLPAAKARYLPLKTAQGIRGVLGVLPAAETLPALGPEQRHLMEAFASQAAVAIERAQLAAEARRAQVLQETERLQSALLNSISHDLRTPLAAVTGALSTLVENGNALDEATRRELLETAREAAQRLNRLVGDLLDMTRLQGGALRLRRAPADIQDLIGTSLSQLGDAVTGRKIEVDVAPNIPLVSVDFALITRVLANIVENAIKYSPPEAPITIRARAVGGNLEIMVADRGPGVLESDLVQMTGKFRRGRSGANNGTGLGLAICRGFVEAHGGRVTVENRPGGGLNVFFTLPLDESPPEEAARIPDERTRSEGASRR
jgi:two-component system sensor histidine kinase KdpD